VLHELTSKLAGGVQVKLIYGKVLEYLRPRSSNGIVFR
jgi:hypothetical protein